MRMRGWIAVLVASLLLSAPALRAQQQEPPAEPAFPERVIEAIGDTLRGIFRAIFGDPKEEGAKPAPQEPQQQPPQPPEQAKPEPPGPAPAPAGERAGTPPQPVAATPSAQATPQTLHATIAKADYEGASKMIELGADIEAKDPGAGASPLHYAVMRGNLGFIEKLMRRGADVNSRTKTGTTPLHTAVLYNRYEVAELLLNKGADINAQSVSGATPLALATAARNRNITALLRERGAR